MLELYPDFHQSWLSRSHVLETLGQYEEAIASCDKALEIQPHFSPAWFFKAQLLARMGHSEDAIASYTKVIEIVPDHSVAWHNRSLALSGIDQHEAAAVGFRKSIELRSDKSSSVSWMCLGRTLTSLGRDEEAIACFDKVLELGNYRQQGTWAGRIVPLLRLGRYREVPIAIYKFMRSFRLDSGFREWIERRVAISLRQWSLHSLVTPWRKLLGAIGFRVKR